MATTGQSYSRSVAGHAGGQQGPLCVPASMQDATKGRHIGRRAPGPLGSGSSSCLFVSPARPTVKVKGLPHASSSRGAQHSCRPYSYPVLHTGPSLLYCRAARRSSTHDESASVSDRTPSSSRASRNPLSTVRFTDPSTGRRFSVCARRGLTAHQAARFLQLQRLQAARHKLPATVGNASDDGKEAAEAAAAAQDAPVDSHPISVPSSGRPSSNGSRDGLRAVQGLPGLPPRSGAGSRSSSRRSSSSDSGQPRSQVQTDFLIMQELLRRDYAVGYIMLGWLLRCTWALTPGIALLLKLPEPAMARSARQQLPALLAWLLFGRGGSGKAQDSNISEQHHQAEQQKALLQQLSPVALKGLQEQLVGPTAALASIASFSKTYQLLANAPVTAQQLVAFMQKEEQLLNKFPGLDLTANLQQGSSAAAVSAVLGDTHTNASAAAAATAAMGDVLSAAAAATEAAAPSTSNAAVEVPSVVSAAAREEAVSALASAVLEGATSAADPALAGLSSLLTQLAKQAGSALQHLVTEQGAGSTQPQQQQEEGGLSPEALLAQLQALQQRLPGQRDVAGLLADYQAWLEQLRGRLLKQHEHTQAHLARLQTQLAATRSDLQQPGTFAAHIEEQQQLMESAKQQALQRYEQAREAVTAVQQQMAAVVSLAPEAQQQQLEQQAQGASAGQQAAARPSSNEQLQMVAAVSSLNEDLEDVSADADRTSGELSTLLSVLTGQLQCIEQQSPPKAATLGPLDSAEVHRLSADAVGDVWWQAGAGSSSINAAGGMPVSQSAAVWSPLDAAEVARLSADAVSDRWPAGSGTVAAPVSTQLVRRAGAAAEAPQPAAVTATALLQQLQLSAQPVAEPAAGHTTETAAGTTQPQQPTQEFSPLQKLLVIDAAFVEPQWRKFVAAAAGLRHSGMQAATLAAQGMGAAAGHLQGAAAGAAQQLQGTAGAAAAGLQSAVSASATQLQQPLAEGAVQLQHQAAAVVSQLQQHAVSATSQLLTGDAAAAAAKLQAEAAAAVTDLQQRAAATAAEAERVISEAKSRVDGKAPGEQRTWQEEVLACSGILSLISPYWWSEETIAGTGGAAGRAGAASAAAAAVVGDAEPLVQGAYGSDGSGMDDGAGGGGPNGPGRGQGGGNSGGDGSSGGEDGSSGGGSGGGQGGAGGAGSGGSNGDGGGGSNGTPWDGFDQFPPSGGFDPVMLVPIALAAARAGLTSLFGSSTSQGTTHAGRRSRSSAHPVQREALKQLKNSSSTNSGSAASASSPQEQRTPHSGRRAAGRSSAAAAAAAVVTATDVQSAAATGVPLLGPGPVVLPQATAAAATDGEHWAGAPFLHIHAQDEPVLAWAGPEAAEAGSIICAAVFGAAAAGSASSPTVGSQQQAAASPGRRRPGSSSIQQAARSASLVPFSTSQQISWEELEDLPLPAKQEILSLRAVVAANKQQQRALQKQLQQVEQHLTRKEQELAASAAEHIVLQAEASAALSQLQAWKGATAAAHSHAAQAAADCSTRSGGISADQLRSTFAAQITHLTKEAAAACSAAARQAAALQAQLDASQQSAADAVATLEMRLSKVTASKARMQLQFEDDVASRDAELEESHKQTAQLQARLQEALEALQESQQVAAEQAAHLHLQDTLAAAAAREQLAQELQDSRRAAAEQQAAAAADSDAAAARIAELQAEVSGLKAGYGPVLLGLEAELATERANAHQLVAQLKQRFADAESSIHSQMQRLQQQLQEAEASCAAASTRSDCLQGDLAAMQQKQNALLAQLQFAKAASAAQVSQLEAGMRALEQQLAQAQAAAEASGASGVAAAAAASAQQLDGSQALVEQLQAQLEAGRSEARERISSLEQQIDQLKQQQLAEAAGAGQQLEALCSTSKQQLEDAHATLETERAAAQQRLSTLTAELEGVQTGYSAFVAKLETELAAERSFSRRQVAEVKEQLLAAQAELSTLQQQLQQQLQQLEADKAALLQANCEQQQAAVAELAAVKAQEEEAEQRCRYLEAELAAATAEEAEEVVALSQALEKQRGEMAAQATALQARLEQQEQEALAQIQELQLQIQQHTARHQQALQQRELESGSALQAAQHALACHTAQLEADLEQTRSSQQGKLSELQCMLTATRRERNQLSAAMLLLSTAVGGAAEQDQGAQDADGAATMAAAQQAVPLAAAVHQLHADVAHLTAATTASQAESELFQAQLADAQQQHQQLQEQHARAQADFAAAQQQLQAALASAEADSTDKAGLIAQLHQQLSAQESQLQELTQQAAETRAAVAVAERHLSVSGSSLTEARVAQLSAAGLGTSEGAELLGLDANLGMRHASQGTAGSVSTVSVSVMQQPSPGSCLMPLLEPSASSMTAAAAVAPDAATAAALAELAGVSEQLATSRQEAAAKAQEVQDFSRSLEASQNKLTALEVQLRTIQDQHSSETASLRQAVSAATAQASELEQCLAAAVAESHRLQQQLCEAERQHAATTAALQQELQVRSSEAAQKVAELEASAAQVAAATERAAAIATKAAADAEAHKAELSAAQAALAAAEQEHSSSVSHLQHELADRTAMIQEAVAAAEAAQAALSDSNTEASALAAALAEAKQSMQQQLEEFTKQHAAATAESAARLQDLKQQAEAQEASAAAAMSQRDQAQQQVVQLQVQLSDAAAVQQEKEATLQQQLAQAQQGLKDNVRQMEEAAQAWAAESASQQERSAALDAERTQLLQRCQTVEQREQQQAEQLKALLATTVAAAALQEDGAIFAATAQDSRRSSVTAVSSLSSKTELLQHSGELAQLAARISGLMACCSQRQRQLDDMSAQLAASAAASDMWRVQAESATKQQVRVTAEHQQAQQRLAAKVAELGLLQQQVEASAGKDAALQQQLLQQLAAAAEQQQSLQAQLQVMQQQLAVAATEKADLLVKCAALQAHCSQLTADQAQQEELQEQVQQLEQDLQDKQQALNQLQQDLSTKAAVEQQLAEQLQELRHALEEQRQQKGAARDERLALQAQLEDAQAQLDATQADIEERRQELSAAQSDLAAAQAELAAAKQDAEQHAAAVESLAADKDAAVAVALEQQHGLARELDAVQAENVALAEQVQRLTDAVSAAADARQELQQQLGQKASVLAAAVTECEAQQARCLLAATATEAAQGGLVAADKSHTLDAHAVHSAALALAAAAAAGDIASVKQAEAVLQEQLNSTCAELDQLMQKCDSLEAKVSRLEPQQASLEAQLAESAAAGEAATSALQAAQQQLAAAYEERAALQQQLQGEQEAHTLTAAAVKELEQQVAKLTAASGSAAQVLTALQDQHAALQHQHNTEVTELSCSKQELDAKVAQLDQALQDASAALASSQQELEAAQEQLEGEQAVHAATAHAKKQLERQVGELHDAAAAAQELEQLQQDLQRKQQQVDAMQSELDDSRNMAADAGMQKQQAEQQATGLEQQLSQAKGDLQTAQQRAQQLQAQLLDVQQELAAAHSNQAELTEQLLEVSAQKAKLAINLSSRGGARATDESGAWKLQSCHDTPRADSEEELHNALASAHQQLESIEQDVLALEYVAEQGALEDIVDLEMHYSNPHLESIHRTVVELRKQAALSSPRGRPLQPWPASIASSEASSLFTASFGGASTAASSRAVSKAGAPGSAAGQHHLAELGAKAGAAASRPLVASFTVDSSLQAAKESLQSMHDADMTLKLLSQSVQDVLARKESGSTRVSESPPRPVTEGDQPADPAAAGKTHHASLDTSLRVQSLLRAKTIQEADSMIAEASDTADHLDEPLAAMLIRSASRTNAAAGGGAGASGGGVSSLGGMSSLSTGSDSTERLSAEIEGYKQQIADLQQKLDAKAAAAAAAAAAAVLVPGSSQETLAELAAQLASAQAEVSEAHAAQQELQQQKAAAEDARQALLLQVSTLTQGASDQRQLSAQLAEAQAANAELSAQAEALRQQLHAAQQQLQERQQDDEELQRKIDRVTALEAEVAALRQLQLERQAYQEQLDRVNALQAEVAALQQQLLQAQRPPTQDVSVEADLLSPRGKSKGLSTCSSAAVSAVRAATHSLLLHSNPFELDLGSEQTMLPTSNDDGCERQHTSTLGGEALLSRPLHAKALMSPTSAHLHSQEMDGMAEMLSSDQQDCLNSQPASAELETEYMRYTRPAHMTQTMLDGANRQPALPSSEVDGEPDAAAAATSQQLCQGAGAVAPTAAAAASSDRAVGDPEDDANRVGLIADSVPASLSAAVGGGAGSRRMSAPGLFTADSDEPQRLAQRALRTLQSQKASLKERGSWPGDDRAASTAQALASAAQDISQLGKELEEQQAAVRQKLAASQALAEGLKRKAAIADMSMDQVVDYFYKVFNTAQFIASDRDRIVEQLIEARVAQQNFSSQLATKAAKIQQLECDRALALQKLWHSEEKLVALEAQLGAFEEQLQERQEGLTAQSTAFDIAAMPAGPLAGLSPRQMSDLFAMLEQANSIVQQQRSKVQEALTKWRRSSGGGSSDGSPSSKRPSSPGGVTGLASPGTAADAAVATAVNAGSRAQLAQLQEAQQQLLQELRRSLSPRSSSAHGQPTSLGQRLSLAVPAGSPAGKADASSPGAAVVAAALPQLDAANLPQEVQTYVASLAERLMSLQGLTQAITAEVTAKHQEVTALQDGFTKVEVTKQLLLQQLQAKSAEAAALEQQLAVLQSELAAARHAAPAAAAAATASFTGSGDITPTGMAPSSRGSSAGGGTAGQSGARLQKPSLAARIRASFSSRHSTDDTTHGATAGNAPVEATAADRLSADSAASSNAAAPTSLLPSVSLFQVAAPSLTGTDDRLATATRAVPGVQELVQHFEEAVVALERTPSCTNSTCSLQSDLQREEQAPHSKGARPAGEGETSGLRASWQRPTPLPRVATLSHSSSAATSPKSTGGGAGSRVPVSPKAASAFGRTVPAALQTRSLGSANSRIPGVASPKSPGLSAGGSGYSTPKRQPASLGNADAGGVDLAAVSSHLRAAASAGGSSSKPAAARTPVPGVGATTLVRTGSASSAKSDASGVSAAAAGELASSSLLQQLSRLVPGTSNGSTGSAGERSGGGSKPQGSIFKPKPAGGKAGSAAASWKQHASGAGQGRKGK